MYIKYYNDRYTVQLAFISPRFRLESTRWQRRLNPLKTLRLNALKRWNVFFCVFLRLFFLRMC